MDYENIAKEILDKGYYQLNDFYDKDEFTELFKYAKDVENVKNVDLIRNFSNPIYELAVPDKVKTLLTGIAHEKRKLLPKIAGNKDLIHEENISMSFARKGPTYNNSALDKYAYHYDDSFVNLVFTFSLPKNSQGKGVFMFKNLKSYLGMGFIAKAVSRVLGRTAWLRSLIKPTFVPYKVGHITLFYGDISLHGVHECLDGDRVSLTVNMSQVSLKEFKKKYNPEYFQNK